MLTCGQRERDWCDGTRMCAAPSLLLFGFAMFGLANRPEPVLAQTRQVHRVLRKFIME
jgi:hypothetical protein